MLVSVAESAEVWVEITYASGQGGDIEAPSRQRAEEWLTALDYEYDVFGDVWRKPGGVSARIMTR